MGERVMEGHISQEQLGSITCTSDKLQQAGTNFTKLCTSIISLPGITVASVARRTEFSANMKGFEKSSVKYAFSEKAKEQNAADRQTNTADQSLTKIKAAEPK